MRRLAAILALVGPLAACAPERPSAGRDAPTTTTPTGSETVAPEDDPDLPDETGGYVLPPQPTAALSPWNGATTGSPWAPDPGLASAPLRPTFRWLSAVGATWYELEADESCAEDFQACLFDSPELQITTAEASHTPEEPLPVSVVQPVGARYAWRVRACNVTACSTWTPTRYVDVGRLGDDFDGDGYSDVLVGAQLNGDDDQGMAYVYPGGPGGLPSMPVDQLEHPEFEPQGWFGTRVVSAGDVDADGYADAAVQSQDQYDGGTVMVYFGGPSGISSTDHLRFDDEDPDSWGFGWGIASGGDIDADGDADLIIGAYGHDDGAIDEGALFTLSGSRDRALASTRMDSPDNQDYARFGNSVASAGDVNVDGYADVVVGAHLYDPTEDLRDAGIVYLYAGGPTGLTPFPLPFPNPDLQALGQYGESVSGGDLNGDGYGDFVVGAAYQGGPETREGQVFVYLGGPAGIDPTIYVRLDNPDDAYGNLGLSTAIGDIDGDGVGDLVVGAPTQSWPEDYEGNAFVYLGDPAGFPDVPSWRLDNPEGDTWSAFGTAVAIAGDIDGDGDGDVLVGMPSSSGGNRGKVFVYEGGPTDPGTFTLRLVNPLDDVGMFGGAVAAAQRPGVAGSRLTPGGA